LVPYLAGRLFPHGQEPQLGGTWLSLAAVQSGALLYWLGLLLADSQALLHAGAFLLWALSALPVVIRLIRVVRSGVDAFAGEGEPLLEMNAEL
ncbi:MAG: hypothetical protein RRC07_01935, partial [Anaerolineae bacterium]|nr:hypothetical protein [Anaerolineae bacterium]